MVVTGAPPREARPGPWAARAAQLVALTGSLAVAALWWVAAREHLAAWGTLPVYDDAARAASAHPPVNGLLGLASQLYAFVVLPALLAATLTLGTLPHRRRYAIAWLVVLTLWVIAAPGFWTYFLD